MKLQYMWRVAMGKFMKMQFNADLKNVPFSRGIVSSFFLDENVTINVINEIKTIVSEAVTNAIVHGYNSDNSKEVTLNLYLDDNILKIIVEDKGVGIEDLNKAKEPLYSTKTSEERAGLGFTIMEIFSDELDIDTKVNEGTKLTITKYL